MAVCCSAGIQALATLIFLSMAVLVTSSEEPSLPAGEVETSHSKGAATEQHLDEKESLSGESASDDKNTDHHDEEWVNEHLPPEIVASYFQGDIILTPQQKEEIYKTHEGEHVQRRAVVVSSRGLWPNGVVPYTLDSSLSSSARRAIREAIVEYDKVSCVKFQPRKGESNYVRFFSGSGCYSYIGLRGGRQDISIGRGCEYSGIVAHEIFHALGRWHEQSRPDRDKYVRINFENIREGYESNFYKVAADEATTNNIDYDIQSIMHYSAYTFSKNRDRSRPTIEAKLSRDKNKEIGQRDGFTSKDIEHINKLYCTKPGKSSSWGSWSSCSATCGGGTQTRSRSCPGDGCRGSSTQTKACNTNACPQTTSTVTIWLSWGPWSSCSASCGGGVQTRSRTCSGCDATSVQTARRSCNTNSCSTGGSWGQWSSWKCLYSRYRMRHRKCVGTGCKGSRSQIQKCGDKCSCSRSRAPAASSPVESPQPHNIPVCNVIDIDPSQLKDMVIGSYDEHLLQDACIKLAASKGYSHVGVMGRLCIAGPVLENTHMRRETSTECQNGTGKHNPDSTKQYVDVYKVSSLSTDKDMEPSHKLAIQAAIENGGTSTLLNHHTITLLLFSSLILIFGNVL